MGFILLKATIFVVITPGKLLIEMEIMSTQFEKNIKSPHYLTTWDLASVAMQAMQLHERT